MRMMIYLATAATLVLMASTSAIAAEAKCTGEIYHSSPPVPNRPTHIRNVIWRNADFLRQACQQQSTIRQPDRPATDLPTQRP